MSKKPILLLQDQYTKVVLDGAKIIVNNHTYTAEEVQDILQNQYKQYSSKGQLTLDDLKKYNRLKKMEKEIEQAVQKLYKQNAAVAYVVFKDVYKIGHKGIANIIKNQANIGAIPKIRNADLEAAVMRELDGIGWTRRLTRYTNETTRVLQDRIREGLSKGETYETIANDLMNKVANETDNTMRIVRTESNRVWNEGKLNAADRISNKVQLEKTWLTAQDERVRSFIKGDKADHTKMNGVTIPYEEEFDLPSGYKTIAPMHSGNAADDINCRCILEIRVKVDEDD